MVPPLSLVHPLFYPSKLPVHAERHAISLLLKVSKEMCPFRVETHLRLLGLVPILAPSTLESRPAEPATWPIRSRPAESRGPGPGTGFAPPHIRNLATTKCP